MMSIHCFFFLSSRGYTSLKSELASCGVSGVFYQEAEWIGC